MQIKTFVFNPFLENTSVLYDQSGNAIIVDPGCYEAEELTDLAAFINTM